MTQRLMNAAALVMLLPYFAISYVYFHQDKAAMGRCVGVMMLSFLAHLLLMAGALLARLVEWRKGEE